MRVYGEVHCMLCKSKAPKRKGWSTTLSDGLQKDILKVPFGGLHGMYLWMLLLQAAYGLYERTRGK
jgi:hypothetical protein